MFLRGKRCDDQKEKERAVEGGREGGSGWWRDWAQKKREREEASCVGRQSC